jgi:hypothetical protein
MSLERLEDPPHPIGLAQRIADPDRSRHFGEMSDGLHLVSWIEPVDRQVFAERAPPVASGSRDGTHRSPPS